MFVVGTEFACVGFAEALAEDGELFQQRIFRSEGSRKRTKQRRFAHTYDSDPC